MGIYIDYQPVDIACILPERDVTDIPSGDNLVSFLMGTYILFLLKKPLKELTGLDLFMNSS